MTDLPNAPITDTTRDDWFVTPSGRRAFVLTPDPDVIAIEDIAHALAQVCRFGGMTRRYFSVAQHSVLVSTLVPEEYALLGLLHDATEAYLGDVIGPLKRQLPRYAELEREWWEAICDAFDLRLPDGEMAYALPAEVKHADLVALVTERRDVAVRERGEQWPWGAAVEAVRPHPMPLRALYPHNARDLFLRRWAEVSDD